MKNSDFESLTFLFFFLLISKLFKTILICSWKWEKSSADYIFWLRTSVGMFGIEEYFIF